MSDDIKELHVFNDSEKAIAIDKAKTTIAQIPNLKDCELDINVDGGYLYLNKLDEQSNVSQWARIAVYGDGRGKDCALMLYDGVWSVCFTGTFRQCLIELDSKLALFKDMDESVELSDGGEGDTVCNTEEVQSEQNSEKATDVPDSLPVETEDVDSEIITTSDNTKDELATKTPLKLSLDQKKLAISYLKSKLMRVIIPGRFVLLKNTHENYICIDRLDENDKQNRWVRIAIYNADMSDCTVMLYDDGTWNNHVSGPYVKCVNELRVKMSISSVATMVQQSQQKELETHRFDKKGRAKLLYVVKEIITGEKLFAGGKIIPWPLPVLKTLNLQFNVKEGCVHLNVVDEQKKSVRWAKIAVHDPKCNDCTLLIFTPEIKKWTHYAKGSLPVCLKKAETAYYESESSTVLTANDVEKHLEERSYIGESSQAEQVADIGGHVQTEVTVPNEEVS